MYKESINDLNDVVDSYESSIQSIVSQQLAESDVGTANPKEKTLSEITIDKFRLPRGLLTYGLPHHCNRIHALARSKPPRGLARGQSHRFLLLIGVVEGVRLVVHRGGGGGGGGGGGASADCLLPN
eukprot:COSAG05_NODE_2111_length_3547_cov_3.036833_7_plen_126_part_00